MLPKEAFKPAPKTMSLWLNNPALNYITAISRRVDPKLHKLCGNMNEFDVCLNCLDPLLALYRLSLLALCRLSLPAFSQLSLLAFWRLSLLAFC